MGSAQEFSVNIEVLMAEKIHSLRRCMILQKQGLAVDERRKLYQAGMLDEELVFSRIKFLRRKGEIREYMTKREREREDTAY